MTWENLFLMSLQNGKIFLRDVKLIIIEYLIAFSILVSLRNDITLQRHYDAIEFAPIEVENLYALREILLDFEMREIFVPINPENFWSLVYSPENDVLKNLLNIVCKDLEIPNLIGVATATDLDKYLSYHDSFVGVEFKDKLFNITSLPKHLFYKLRFPHELRTFEKESYQSYFKYPYSGKINNAAPRNIMDNDGGRPGYIREGFAIVQNAIHRAFIKQQGGQSIEYIVQMRRFPHTEFGHRPEFKENYNVHKTVGAIVLTYLLPTVVILQNIVEQRSSPIIEILKIREVTLAMHWMSYWIVGMIKLFFFNVFVTIMLTFDIYLGEDNLVIFGKTEPTIVFTLLQLYCCGLMTKCFLVSALFRDKKKASAFFVVLKILCFSIFLFMLDDFENINFLLKIIVFSIPENSLKLGFLLISHLEVHEHGITWDEIWDPITLRSNVQFGLVLITFLFNAPFLLMMAYYVHNILSGFYVQKHEFYFPLLKSFWKNEEKRSVLKERKLEGYTFDKTFEENEWAGFNKVQTIRINQLRKVLSTKTILYQQSYRIYSNEITVIIGHEGSGKSSLISLIAGLMQPTSGTITINGKNVIDDAREARKHLDICTTNIFLSPKLTVLEYIIFYCRLKHALVENISKDIEKMLVDFEIDHIAFQRIGNLNDGEKCQLCLLLAACAGTKIILCDEPTKYTDPISRKRFWETLHSLKANRTILVTVSEVEEAFFADRIGIMSGGVLKCFGSLQSLRKQFGTGYRLTCVKDNNFDVDSMEQLLKKYIPDYYTEKVSQKEMAYRLPQNRVQMFPKFLTLLQNYKSTIGIKTFGIQASSLEDIYLKICTGDHGDGDLSRHPKKRRITFHEYIEPTHGAYNYSIFRQIKAICYKKLVNAVPNTFVIFMLFFSIVFIKLVTSIQKGTSETLLQNPPIRMTLNDYDKPIFLSDMGKDAGISKLEENIRNYVEKYKGKLIHVDDVQTNYLESLGKNSLYTQVSHLCGFSYTKNVIVVGFNNQYRHMVPICLNIVHNGLIRSILSDEYKIHVASKPLSPSHFALVNHIANGIDSYQLILIISVIMTFVTSHFIMFITIEKSSKVKLLQYLAGIRGEIFWIVGFICDFIYYLYFLIQFMVIISLFKIHGYSQDNSFALLSAATIYGFTSLSFIYLMSKAFTDASFAFYVVEAISLFFGVFLYSIYYVLMEKNVGYLWLFLLSPYFNFAEICHRICVFDLLHKSCLDYCLRRYDNGTCSYQEFCEEYMLCCALPKSLFSLQYPGIIPNFTFLIISSILFLFILILCEYQYFDTESTYINYIEVQKREKPYKINEEVRQEINRVKDITISKKTKNYNLVVHRLGTLENRQMHYLSFCIEAGEIFAIYGPGRTGKSEIIRMIAGDKPYSVGNIYISGVRNGKSGQIGYYPQFNGLLPDFTAYELINMFCMIRGIKFKNIKKMLREISRYLNLKKLKSRRVKDYTRDDQKKLSIAIALLSGSELVILDEPTSAVDPSARQEIWNVVSFMQTYGRSFLLTTQSLRDCEMLANRIGTLINHEIKYLGSVQQLQSKYCNGFLLEASILWEGTDTVKAKENYDINTENITQFLIFHFISARFLGDNGLVAKYMVETEQIDWPKIFFLLEKFKNRLNISDYVVERIPLAFKIFSEAGK